MSGNANQRSGPFGPAVCASCCVPVPRRNLGSIASKLPATFSGSRAGRGYEPVPPCTVSFRGAWSVAERPDQTSGCEPSSRYR